MGYVYIAGTYTDTNKAIQHARYQVMMEACAYFKNRGECVYSPICSWHEIANKHELPTDYRSWEHDNEIMLKAASLLRVLDLPGLDQSKGTAREICWANQWGMPIEIYDPSGFDSFRYFESRGML